MAARVVSSQESLASGVPGSLLLPTKLRPSVLVSAVCGDASLALTGLHVEHTRGRRCSTWNNPAKLRNTPTTSWSQVKKRASSDVIGPTTSGALSPDPMGAVVKCATRRIRYPNRHQYIQSKLLKTNYISDFLNTKRRLRNDSTSGHVPCKVNGGAISVGASGPPGPRNKNKRPPGLRNA